MTSPTTYAKAVVSALIAGLTALGTALTDGGVSAQEWTAVAVATLAALGIVWAVPNAPETVRPQFGDQDERDHLDDEPV